MKIGMYGGSFNPLHNGHIKCINKALEMCDELHLIIGDLPNRDVIPFAEKIKWFEEVFKNKNVVLHPLTDPSKEKKEYTLDKWVRDAEIIKHIIGKHIDIVFCGADYNRTDNPYLKCYPDSEIYYFDREDNISSSEFKKDIFKYKNWVPECVFKSYEKRIIYSDIEGGQ